MGILDLIKEDEGLRLHVYDDATGKPIVKGYTCVGNPTIGYGRLLTEGRGITLDEAEAMLHRDVQETTDALYSNYWWFIDLSQERKDVLTSMAFNMGMPRFVKFKKMLGAIQDKDFNEAAAQILDSNAARQLPERYGRLSQMMRNEHY